MLPAAMPIVKLLTNKYVWIVIIALSVYGYVSYLQNENDTLVKNNAIRGNVIEHQNKAIASLREDIELKDAAQKRFSTKEKMYQSNIDRLNTKLTESKNKEVRNITKLAKAKPKMIGKIITRGAKFRNRCFEILSGSLILPEELEVAKKDRNNVCPELYQYEE